MHSFITCHIPNSRSRVQIGFDQLSPSALSTRDLGTRLALAKSIHYNASRDFLELSSRLYYKMTRRILNQFELHVS